MRRYIEVSSNGFDEALVGISSSPFSRANPSNVGLRIPSLVPAFNAAQPTQNRYLFLLATRTCNKPTRIRSIRQLLTIGTSVPRTTGEGTLPELPVEFHVTTPNFQFTDGNVSWHLVFEPNPHRINALPPLTDAQSFRFLESDGPSLLYQTFAASTVNSAGAPVNYPNTLTAYTAPPIWNDWTSVDSDLLTWNDIRFPWNQSPTESVDIPIDIRGGSAGRISLYASVLQTSARAIFIPNYANPLPASANITPEWLFVLNNFNLSTPASTLYWRVGGSLVFMDEE